MGFTIFNRCRACCYMFQEHYGCQGVDCCWLLNVWLVFQDNFCALANTCIDDICFCPTCPFAYFVCVAVTLVFANYSCQCDKFYRMYISYVGFKFAHSSVVALFARCALSPSVRQHGSFSLTLCLSCSPTLIVQKWSQAFANLRLQPWSYFPPKSIEVSSSWGSWPLSNPHAHPP